MDLAESELFSKIQKGLEVSEWFGKIEKDWEGSVVLTKISKDSDGLRGIWKTSKCLRKIRKIQLYSEGLRFLKSKIFWKFHFNSDSFKMCLNNYQLTKNLTFTLNPNHFILNLNQIYKQILITRLTSVTQSQFDLQKHKLIDCICFVSNSKKII